eukprot:gene4562-5159_t
MANVILIGLLLQSTLFHGAISWIVRRHCLYYGNFSYVKPDEVQLGTLITTLYGMSSEQCEHQCIYNWQCDSINTEHGGERKCQLNHGKVSDVRVNVTLTPMAGWTYKTTEDSERLLGATCKQLNPCQANQICEDICTCPGYKCHFCRGKKLGIPCSANIVLEGVPLGLENYRILNPQIKESSYNPNQMGYLARLNANSKWCTHSGQLNTNQYLQVDFQRSKIITDVAVQGAGTSQDWVTSYKLKYTEDKVVWKTYEEDGAIRLFQGPTSSINTKKQSLLYYIKANSVRINPQTWETWICMRVEIYGFKSMPLGLEDRTIQDYQISASSYKLQNWAKNVRLNGGKYWEPFTVNKDEFIRVDFITRKVITHIATQGEGIHSIYYVRTFHLKYTENNYDWVDYKNSQGAIMTFDGTTAPNTINKQTLPKPIHVFGIKISPQTFTNAPCMRMEVYGYEDEPQPPIPTGCLNSVRPLGMASKRIPDSSITGYSSYDYEQKYARLNGDKYWRGHHNVPVTSQYIRVNLGKKTIVEAVAIQGRKDHDWWVKSFKIGYSNDGSIWSWVEDGSGHKIFTGSVSRNDIVKHKFNPRINAQHVRLDPKEVHYRIALRMELYGCDPM